MRFSGVSRLMTVRDEAGTLSIWDVVSPFGRVVNASSARWRAARPEAVWWGRVSSFTLAKVLDSLVNMKRTLPQAGVRDVRGVRVRRGRRRGLRRGWGGRRVLLLTHASRSLAGGCGGGIKGGRRLMRRSGRLGSGLRWRGGRP